MVRTPQLRLWSQWKGLKLVNGVLYRSFESDDDAATHLQLVAPPSLKPQILKALHDDCAGGHLGSEKTLEKALHDDCAGGHLGSEKPLGKVLHDDCAGGHLGSEKTLEKVRRRFYCPFMSSDVEAYCCSCPDCEARNSSAPKSQVPMQTV